ncbi:ABC transporter substrate-binding protein [Motiliproteus coralliicola]|nr:ABC transporter substrate-binding protein [Motiliproteus coralliicola]
MSAWRWRPSRQRRSLTEVTMRPLVLLLTVVLMISSTRAQAEVLHELRPLGREQSVLRIYGAADFPVIKPFFDAFRERYPGVRIRYSEFGTRNLYQRFLERYPDTPDLMLSSAMDLQVKLVNDGYAQPYRSPETAALPAWANWRDEIFGFTYEPAVIAINRQRMPGDQLPRNRAELLDLIRRHSDKLRGRIGTFDIAQVGVGYLTWSYDSRQSASYGRMLESFGSHQARLFPSSAAMLQALTDGEITVAYNLLGSYSHAWAKRHPEIQVVLPSDYTTLVMRTAFIPDNAANPTDAKRLLDFLLSREGQQLLADRSSLYPIREDITGETTASALRRDRRSPLRHIPLGPSLLIQTDQASRRALLEQWRRAMPNLDLP